MSGFLPSPYEEGEGWTEGHHVRSGFFTASRQMQSGCDRERVYLPRQSCQADGGKEKEGNVILKDVLLQKCELCPIGGERRDCMSGGEPFCVAWC